MTRDEILAIPDGRQLDRLVAQHVMGMDVSIWRESDGVPVCPFDNGPGMLPLYTSGHSTSWVEVLHRIAKLGFQVTIDHCPTKMWPHEAEAVPEDERWRCGICAVPGTDMCWTHVFGPTAAIAVCRCALLVMMLGTEEMAIV